MAKNKVKASGLTEKVVTSKGTTTKSGVGSAINTVSGGSKAAGAVAGAKNLLMKAANNAQNAYKEAQGKEASNQARLADEQEQQRQQEEMQRQMQEFLNNYAPSVDYMGVYNDYASRMNNILQQQKDALNQQTTSRARSAYVANEQGKNEIPRLLSNAGVTGGLAEKVRTNQNTSYQQNLANILSDTATQGAELERNNANLISEAYKEAMSNQQAVDNERALAAQQYANQLALIQQQQAYEEQQARTEAANNGLNAALTGGFKDSYDSKGKFKTSAANQMSGYYNQAKASGASQATLDNFEHAMILAAQARYNSNPDNRKEKLTWQQYKQKYVGDRIGKVY